MAVDTPAKIAILGAGPIGLETGLYARFLGYQIVILEQGHIAQNVSDWGHVKMFSPFRFNHSPLGLAAIGAQNLDYQPPQPETIHSGKEWIDRYLHPLSQTDLLADSIREECLVVGVGRSGPLKQEFIGEPSREKAPFRILIRASDGSETTESADIVIDTTGTYGNHNWMGQGGLPAVGESRLQTMIEYGIPDISGAEQAKYANQHTLLIGSGYSAASSAVALVRLNQTARETKVTWVTRSKQSELHTPGPISRIARDSLRQRDELAVHANQLLEISDCIRHWSETSVDNVAQQEDGNGFCVRFLGQHQGDFPFDRIIANVGYRADRHIYRELQVHECYATEGPIKLAASLLANPSSDCLDHTSGGPEDLINPEPNFYILGSKSFGRSSQFLYSLGLQQIRELFTLIGERKGLDLYSTIQSSLP
ncbi:MAG: hypothetical protein CMJ81_02840 [Planctomycetaceae bacterium]|nr:hypothetical protein [Planctomycetaceae bacterium]MBP60776.1 hypothetical protein [Planctomycetaceae bacterium]